MGLFWESVMLVNTHDVESSSVIKVPFAVVLLLSGALMETVTVALVRLVSGVNCMWKE